MIRSRNYVDNVSIKLDPATGAEYVDFSAGSIGIGEPVVGASPNEILFVNGAGNLAQDPALQYNDATHTLSLAGPFHHVADGEVSRFAPSAVHGAAPKYYEQLAGSVNLGGSWNPILQALWNGDNTALPIDPAYGTVGVSVEGNFEASAGVFQGEYHQVFGRADGLEQVRAWSAFMRWATGHTEAEVTVDAFRIKDAQAPNGLLLDMTGNEAGADQANANLLSSWNIRKHTADNDSYLFSLTGAAGKSHTMQIVTAGGGSVALNTFGLPNWYYSDTGGSASHLFRTGVTMGQDGSKAANIVNLTLVPTAAQSVPLLDLSGAAATLAPVAWKRTSDAPVGIPSGFLKILDGATPYYIAVIAA